MRIYRIIDANLNRASEGLRVLEDISRFVFNDQAISKEFRDLRHGVRKNFTDEKLILNRNAREDVGLKTSRENKLDTKDSIDDLLLSNFKRVEEALRAIEESLKLIGHYESSKEYELMRFKVYDLEKRVHVRRTALNSDIYGILGEDFSRGRSNLEVVEELRDAGVKIIQYREKTKSKEEKFKECLEIRKITREAGMFFIVNDDLDIALAVDADGLHIGQDDLSLEIARLAAPHLIIGLSTNNKEEALRALEQKPDYIGVGPVFHTDTKDITGKEGGLDFVKWVAENIDLPFVTIGGIGEENILQVKENGGYCFSMISELVGAEDIEAKVRSIRAKLKEDEK